MFSRFFVCYNRFMKFFKKVLVLILILIGVIGVIGEIGGRWEGKPAFTKVPAGKQEIKEKVLKFAVMSDIHSDWENFRKALEKAKGETGDKSFVIITGDITTIGKKDEFLKAKEILNKSGIKYFVIPGNHDIWLGRKIKEDIFGEVFGKSFQSFKIDGYKFILVNNGDDIGGIGGVRSFGGESQKEWLIKETEECLKLYCLVFMHMPLNHPSSIHVMGEGSETVALEAKYLIELFKKNKVKEIFAGHLHYSSSYLFGGLRTNIVGAITAERNIQSPKFMEVITKGEVLEKNEVFITN